MKTWADFNIDIPAGAPGPEVSTTCPRCSRERKNQRARCLSANVEKACWHCNHCGWAGSLKTGQELRAELGWRKPQWRKPEPRPALPLSDRALAWFRERGITDDVLLRNGIHSTTVYMPQVENEVSAIAFPYRRGGEVVNYKFRDGRKNFRMETGAERVLYGLDDIDAEALVWVEGEMDALSIEVAGITSRVSVPDGAPAEGTKDYSSKFTFLDSAQDALAGVKRHIIAVDNDAPGKRLEDELARRLGREKCWRVTWPEGCKDANEVLVRHGALTLRDCIEASEPFPVEGVFTIETESDKVTRLYEQGYEAGHKTGWWSLDPYYTVRPGELTVVTGVPSSGKSNLIDALLVNLASLHGWGFAIFSPENQPIEDHMGRVVEKYVGKPFSVGPTPRMDRDELKVGMDWARQHFWWILPPDEKQWEIGWLLARAKELVYRHGIRGLVIDPWNELEPQRSEHESETEYVSRVLRTVRQWGRHHGVHVWMVVHPTKLYRDKDGQYPVPTLYDCAGCYDDQTEVLTGRGWRKHADITSQDTVCCFDAKTNTLRYERPTAMWRAPYDGDMVRVKSDSLDALVTPNHTMLVKPSHQKRREAVRSGKGRPFRWREGEWNFIRAEELPASFGGSVPWATPIQDRHPESLILRFRGEAPALQRPCVTCGKREAVTKGRCARCNTYLAANGRERPASRFDRYGREEFATDDVMRLLGWWISEGHAVVGGGISIAQAVGPIADRMRETFARMGLVVSERTSQPGSGGKKAGLAFCISKRAHPELCDWVASECGRGARNKRIPAMVWDLSREQKTILLEALIDGDGCRKRGGNATYTTTSPALADDVQRLAIECGRMANVASRLPPDHRHARQYWLSIGAPTRREIGLRARRHISMERYVGEVFCLTVPTGAYVTRRNGRPGIYGNSAHWRNKADNGLCVWRDMSPDSLRRYEVDIHVQKIRFRQIGKLGKVTLKYSAPTATYEDIDLYEGQVGNAG